jgi:HK97 family phage prohead protease
MITIVRGRPIQLKSASGDGEKKHQLKSNLRFQVKDADKGLVEAVFSTFNVMDHDHDITLPGAFEDGAKVAISAYGHKSWMGMKPVGRGVIRVEKSRAILEGQFFLDTIDGADTFKVIKGMDELQEWSYGYDVLETGEVTEELRQKGVWRVIKKAKVYEVSPVLVGAGIDTETLTVKGKKDEPTAEQLAAAAALSIEARKEFATFMKTRARLVS